jgi:hypothetical protein
MPVAVVAVETPVPPAKSTVTPSLTVKLVPESPCKVQLVYPPGTDAQTLSPLKNVEPLGEPEADKSIVPIVTAPVADELTVDAETNVPLALVKVVTPTLTEPLDADVINPFESTVILARV